MLFRYDADNGETVKLYLILGFSVALGSLISYFTYSIKRLAILVLSCGVGVVVALQVFVVLAFTVEAARKQEYAWLLCFVFGLAFGLLSDYSQRVSVILASALGGSYLLLKGVGMLLKNYPDELTIVERIQLHQYDQIPAAYFVYLALMLVLAVAGAVVQFKYAVQSDDVALEPQPEPQDVYSSISQDDSADLGDQSRKKNRPSVGQRGRAKEEEREGGKKEGRRAVGEQ